ncbi:alpha/beta hydrolase [Zavarzinella formosa]|uniref:alpha/beta hydrolase n=1 Tax=Zavarzinella formosa TaxID=360055 RepID=UPI00031FDC90|nr:alpha/beta fold hydrolase [Zavarzinella formosa]
MKTAIGLFLLALPLLAVMGTVFVIYRIVCRHYLWQLVRIFQEKPLFVIPRGEPDPTAEELRVPTCGGAMLQAVYFRTSAAARKGVIVFGIEHGSDRWSCKPYCDPLIQAGYDIFAYEPRNQGKSDTIPDYEPIQWISDYEIEDAKAAMAYVKARPDADPKGVGWFGVSKGANVGLAMFAEDSSIRCAVTDGAFGLLSVMVPYMRHWIRIYNSSFLVHGLLPGWFYQTVGRRGVGMVEKERKVRFYHLEPAASRLVRPLLMIHGEADSYIKTEMARTLFLRARGPKEFWVVPKARHNQALAMAGDEYSRRVVAFFDHYLR